MGAFDPDYEEYKAFGGTLESKTFSALLPKASALVRDLEFPNEPSDSSAEAHKRAVCAAVSAFGESQAYAGGGFSIGSFSVSGGGYSESVQAVADAARRELVGSGLLFKGMIR